MGNTSFDLVFVRLPRDIEPTDVTSAGTHARYSEYRIDKMRILSHAKTQSFVQHRLSRVALRLAGFLMPI